ncbi:nuclease-related domain-containing protein [Lysinibacillus endophyticus]|uniref:nuclease-related domain-containing protein n=1 Tax=Ureibacillus endophyticus TaxID=1978490 RepID=UPI0031348EBA
MAQLVKLQDYISRYETALTRYPTQFVRLKQNQWDRVKTQWLSGEELPNWEHIETDEENEEPKERFTFFKKIFRRNETEENIEEVNVENELVDNDEIIPEDETTTLFFEPKIVYHPQTLEELKVMFLDQFFHFQLKWASSTLREKSYVDPKFLRDTLLRNILQQLPDSYLIFYYPIIKVKKAPVELDVIILTPTECICITVVENDNMAVYVGNSERFWTEKVGKVDKKILNPLIQLNRMESVISQIFTNQGVDIPIRKVLLSRNGYFDYPGSLYNVQFIDKREFPKWLMQLKRSISPMKRMQMQAAQSILNHVQTTSFNRDIWNVENLKE